MFHPAVTDCIKVSLKSLQNDSFDGEIFKIPPPLCGKNFKVIVSIDILIKQAVFVNKGAYFMYFSYTDEELKFLASKDRILGEYIEKKGRIEREIYPDVFSCVVNSIAGQQISSAALNSVWEKLIGISGGITAEKLHALSAEEIKGSGMSLKKAENIKAFTESVFKGETDIESFAEKSDEEVITELTAFRGIGRWTAEMVLIFAMNRKNVLSFGDFGIKKGICSLYGYEKITKEIFSDFRERFSPYGTLASFYLWEGAREELSFPKEDFAVINTPLGRLKITALEGKINSVLWTEEKERGSALPVIKNAAAELSEYFSGKRKVFTVPVSLEGTDFRKKVWAETAKIPYGETRAYKEIAEMAGNEKGCRAVGGAVNKNPVNIIIPCHRVVGSKGSLTGYAGGLWRKEKLLELEKQRS